MTITSRLADPLSERSSTVPRRALVFRLAASLSLALALVACSTPPDSALATEIYAECLERNGIEAEGVQVTLDSDGTVASIEERIIGEVDTAFMVTVRQGCIAEVEDRT